MGASDRDRLTELVSAWVAARPMTVSITLSERMLDPVEVPERLIETVTAVEPWRARVLVDARRWLAAPQPFGVGPRFRILEPFEPAPLGSWAASVSPLLFEMCVSDRMSDHDAIESVHRMRIDRVVLEDGRWRIASLWSEEEAARARAEDEQLRAFLVRRAREGGESGRGG